jgi:hypothetical protein
LATAPIGLTPPICVNDANDLTLSANLSKASVLPKKDTL